MAFEKEIAHSLYSAYEVYLDLKAQLHDVQQLRTQQLQEALSRIPEPVLEETDKGKGGHEHADHDVDHAVGKKKPIPTIDDHEQQIHRDLDELAKKIENLVQSLTQNHTTAPTMLGEFENLRTFKIMSGEKFALNSVLPLKPNR